jgi:hypothetical protein
MIRRIVEIVIINSYPVAPIAHAQALDSAVERVVRSPRRSDPRVTLHARGCTDSELTDGVIEAAIVVSDAVRENESKVWRTMRP